MKISRFKILCAIALISLGIAINFRIKPIQAQNLQNLLVCNGKGAETAYELSDSWIYICQENAENYYLQVDKANKNQPLILPASGSFYTYAASDGDLGKPETKLYNIGPLEFKIIQNGIIIKTEKVIRTIDGLSGAIITVLPEDVETKAKSICGQDTVIEAFDTANYWVYLCINDTQDENQINLTYIQIDKSSPKNKINLPAQLMSDWSYSAKGQNVSYKISPRGLQIIQPQQEIDIEAVNFVYLKGSDSEHEITDNPQN